MNYILEFSSCFLIAVCFSIGSVQLVVQSGNYTSQDIIVLITAAISFISAIIILPDKIVQFFFNGLITIYDHFNEYNSVGKPINIEILT